MKRELMSVLLGAALLIPAAEADAQRPRSRAADRSGRVERLAPITVGARVSSCRAPAHAPAHGCRGKDAYGGRVVYSGPVAYRSPRVVRPYRDARVRIRADWVRASLRFSLGRRFDRMVHPAELRRLLGHRTVSRIRNAGHRAGLRGLPRGHWVDSRRHGLVLVVTMDRVDMAEFIDYDRDGWFDDAFLVRHEYGGRWVTW